MVDSNPLPLRPEHRPVHRPAHRAAPLVRSVAALTLFSGLILAGRASLATHYHVPSGSMRPTIQEGDRLWVNKAAYGLRIPSTHRYLARTAEPQPGDVVVLDSPADGVLLVKRVVAGPGDRLLVRGGRVQLNGRWASPDPDALPGGGPGLDALTTPTTSTGQGGQAGQTAADPTGELIERFGDRKHRISLGQGGGPDLGPLRVPEGHFVVLGDNRGDSADSRYFGPVPRAAILGRVSGIFLRHGRPTWIPL